jgi:hypothetical protein
MFPRDRYEPQSTDEKRQRSRYGTFDVGDGTTVVYDRDAEDAWMRSTRAVALDERR